MSFFIFKLCNYLLMENQKYISELQNILNKKKMDGGFGERFQEEVLQARMFPNQQTKSGENQIKETSIDNDPNRELKNTFEKVNFQSEIETLDNYLGMLKECDNNDISKFIKTNKINQEQIAINENAVNKLENTNNELKESIKKKEQEIAELKKTQSGENAKYQKELENEQVKIFDKEEKLKVIKEKLEKLQEKSAAGIQDNGSNNDEINQLNEQLNLLKSEIDKKKNEKKKLESKEVENVEKLKLEEAELESLKKILENNITEIEKLAAVGTQSIEIDRLKAQLNSSQINNSNQIQRGGKTIGGFFESKDQVLNPNEFKRIKNTIDFIVIKLNNYKKTLEIEKNWKKKYAKKLNIIDRLIDVSKKINKLYEGTGYEKMRDSVSSAWSGIKDKFKKRGGQSRQKSPFRLRSGGDDSGNSAVQEDKDVKPLTKEKCKKLRKYLDEFSQLLAAIDNDEGEPIVEDIKSDVSDLSTSNNSNSLIDKIMNIQSNYTNSDSDSYQNNATEILTKTTMIIYDTLLISIVIICIIVYVLFVINIIKFLYQCFLEVGNSQHNNLLTANTLRYKLLGYVIYINNCNLPSLFSSFNSVDTPSSTFIRLTEVLKNYFTNNPIDSVDTFESIFGGLEDTVNFLDTPETKAEKKVDEWRRDTQEGQQADDKTFKTKKKEFLDAEIELGEKEKKREYEENKGYKEPKFNIFLCIRLIFICIKLFITFITIIIISSIICILLAIVSDSINMEKITINIFYNQKLFTLLIDRKSVV